MSTSPVDEHARAVVRHEHAVRVIDRVARKAAHAEERRLRPRGVADHADVALPVAIDLHGSDHRVTTTAPQQVEGARVRHPPLDDWLGAIFPGADGHGLGHQHALGVRHQERWVEGQLRERCREPRKQPDPAREHLAVVTPGLGGGDDAELGERVVLHVRSRRFRTPAPGSRRSAPLRRPRRCTPRGRSGRRTSRGTPARRRRWPPSTP